MASNDMFYIDPDIIVKREEFGPLGKEYYDILMKAIEDRDLDLYTNTIETLDVIVRHESKLTAPGLYERVFQKWRV